MAGEEGFEVKSFHEVVLMPLKYLEQAPGSNWSIKLHEALNYWLNIPLDKSSEILDIVQLVHEGIVLVDDIEDGSEKRRGIPCAHRVFGVGRTFNSANYAYFLALEKTLKLGHPDAVKVFTEQLLELHRGQGMDLHWTDTFLCPSEKEYKEMAFGKSVAFFQLVLKLMQLFSENKTDFTQIIEILGFYWQFFDDYANLMSRQVAEEKGFCEDITGGKFSFPMIHAIRNNPDDSRLMNIIKQRTADVELIKYALDIMEDLGSLEYTRKVLSDLKAQNLTTCQLTRPTRPWNYQARQNNAFENADLTISEINGHLYEHMQLLYAPDLTFSSGPPHFNVKCRMREEIARLGHNPYLIDFIEEMDGVVT